MKVLASQAVSLGGDLHVDRLLVLGPVEEIASLRAMPSIKVLRSARRQRSRRSRRSRRGVERRASAHRGNGGLGAHAAEAPGA
jgi:transketolase